MSIKGSTQGRKIKIVSADHPRNWYADKIGQEFIVHSRDSRNKDNIIVRTTIEQAGWKYGWVALKDCEFVNQEAVKVSERQSLYELQKQCPHPKDMTEQKYLYINDSAILDYEYCGKCGKRLGEEKQS